MGLVRTPEAIRESGKRLLRVAFNLGQRLGVDILPRHFYSSIPDMRDLQRYGDWRQRRSMVGISGASVEEQVQFLHECCPPELRDTLRRKPIHAQACEANSQCGFGPIESDFLFAFIATKRPSRVIQIGAGVSTAVILAAAREVGYEVEIVAIDPFPTKYLRKVSEEGKISLLVTRAQDVPLETLVGEEGSVLLFVDSTHTVKVGSEVNWIVLEVLPRLPIGTIVHFHDIFFPYDYQRDLESTVFFWSESTLLHALLLNNTQCSLRLSMSMVHYDSPIDLKVCLPKYNPQSDDNGLPGPGKPNGHFPSSAYLEIMG